MNELIICAQINEGTPRDPNPHIPFTPEEIADVAAASVAAGASMMHVHARTPDGGVTHSADAYRRIAAAVHARTDILIAPALLNEPGAGPEHRISYAWDATVPEPEQQDVVVVDMGTSNMDLALPDGSAFATDDRVLVNDVASQRAFLRAARERGLPVMATSFGASWSRAIAVHAAAGDLPTPALVLLVHGGPEFVAAQSLGIEGFLAHLASRPSNFDQEWMVSAYRGDVLEIAEEAIRRGGHVAIGTGDHHHRERGLPSTPELVAEVAELGRRHGRRPATPSEVRARFARGKAA